MSGSRRRWARPRLEVEGLEGRVLLAGDVSVFLDADGNLIVEGDNQANCIELDQFGDFTVRGCDAGGGPTRINGVPNGEVEFGVLNEGDIKIRLKGGDDGVRVGFNSDSVNPPDDLEIDTGGGNDEVEITGDTNIGDDLEITTGGGNDDVVVMNTTTGVADDTVIDTGDGADSVAIIGSFGDDLEIKTGRGDDSVNLNSLSGGPGGIFNTTVADDTVIDTGDGADTVATIGSFDAGGDLEITTGGGNDSVGINSLVTPLNTFVPTIVGDTVVDTGGGDDEVVIQGGTNIGDDLDVATGTGADLVKLLGVTVVDDAEVETDSGADRVFIDDSLFQESSAVTTGSQHDFVQICHSVFRDDVDVDLGGGDDGLCVPADPFFGGPTFEDEDVVFDGGSGIDTVAFPTAAHQNFENEVDDCSFFPEADGTCGLA
jgi:hypothetical protein